MTGTITLSDTTGDSLLGIIVSGAAYTSLHSGNPSVTGANELTATGYARQATTLAAAAGQTTSNTGTLTFGPAVGDWPAATYFGLWDAISGGNFLCGGPLNASKTVLNGDSASFADAALSLTI